jgi:hypothetical protein
MLGTRKNQVLAIGIGALVVVILTIAGLRSAEHGGTALITPPYYQQPPAHLAAVLQSKWFSDAETKASYEAASTYSQLFAQLPCYCHCERTHGHKSLLSCFADAHGAECSICRREALFARSEARKGKPVIQIREEIIRGLWAQDGDVTVKSENYMSGHIADSAH